MPLDGTQRIEFPDFDEETTSDGTPDAASSAELDTAPETRQAPGRTNATFGIDGGDSSHAVPVDAMATSEQDAIFFAAQTPDLSDPHAVVDLPVDALFPPLSGRKEPQLDEVAGLVRMIEQDGLLHPILVARVGEHEYRILEGYRRWVAYKHVLKRPTIPARIYLLDIANATEEICARRIEIISNRERRDVDELTYTLQVINLLAAHLESTCDHAIKVLRRMHSTNGLIINSVLEAQTIVYAFESINEKWNSFAGNQLSLLTVADELKDAILNRKLHYTKAKILNAVKDPALRSELLEATLANGLTKPQLEGLVAERQPKRTRKFKFSSDPRKRSLQRVTQTEKLLRRVKDRLSSDLVEEIDVTIAQLITKIEAETQPRTSTSDEQAADASNTKGNATPTSSDAPSSLPF